MLSIDVDVLFSPRLIGWDGVQVAACLFEVGVGHEDTTYSFRLAGAVAPDRNATSTRRYNLRPTPGRTIRGAGAGGQPVA